MSESLDPAQILSRTAAVYAGCRSYVDEGMQRTEFRETTESSSSSVQTIRFRTAFVRPDLFLFDYSTPDGGAHRSVSWSDGRRRRHWTTLRMETREYETIGASLAAPTGTSGGTAVIVPKLLMPEIPARGSMPDLRTARLVGTETVDGETALRLEGPGRRLIVWIDARTHLLLRHVRWHHLDAVVREEHRQRMKRFLGTLPADDPDRQVLERGGNEAESQPVRDFTACATTTWKPRLDVDVDRSVFDWTPPST